MTAARSFDDRLDTYLDILLKLGLNLQPDQALLIDAGIADIEDMAPVVRLLARKAYTLGARHVFVDWSDAQLERTRLLAESEGALSEVPMWQIHWLEELGEQGAAFLSLYAPDPHLNDGIDPARLTISQRARMQAGAKVAAAAAALRHPWLVGSLATRAWARSVYPDKPEAEAITALWDYIFMSTRVNEPDPLAAWRTHLDTLNKRVTYLNAANFRYLHYHAPGTDLQLQLPGLQEWVGGGNSVSAQGIPFVPNLPTEEVFCAPYRAGVDGVVTSTLPLNYNGQLVEGIRIRFENGRIVEYGATKGREALEEIIETDEGSHYLGEVALVTVDSPVNTGTPVLNTLFDENASCHLAIGRAYPINVHGGASMSQEELAAHGLNYSLAHVDFMVGSDQLDIDGETASGARQPILRGGKWVAQ
jgi:aminopeptidase